VEGDNAWRLVDVGEAGVAAPIELLLLINVLIDLFVAFFKALARSIAYLWQHATLLSSDLDLLPNVTFLLEGANRIVPWWLGAVLPL